MDAKKLSRLGRNVLLQPYYAHDLRFCGANTLNSIRFAITPITVLPKTMTSAAKYYPPD